MNKKQFGKLKESLIKKGYKIYNQQWHHEDYVIGKGFHKEDNHWAENRYAYKIILSIYDYSIMRNQVGIEIYVDVSRTSDERLELYAAWYDDTKIEDVERVAEDFFRWVISVYPEPRS